MSHVVHENLEEYWTEDLNPLVSSLIPHSASLRDIFMILPLFLVLVPEASSDNMTEIRKNYRYILVPVVESLEQLINNNTISSCNIRRCNPSSLENTTITCLTECLKIETNCTNINLELKKTMHLASELSTEILKNHSDTVQPRTTPHHKSRCFQKCKRNFKKCDFTHTLCCLKNVVTAFSSWWRKLHHHSSS